MLLVENVSLYCFVQVRMYIVVELKLGIIVLWLFFKIFFLFYVFKFIIFIVEFFRDFNIYNYWICGWYRIQSLILENISFWGLEKVLGVVIQREKVRIGEGGRICLGVKRFSFFSVFVIFFFVVILYIRGF